MSSAPIVCFVYNRPAHTRRALQALSRCDGAEGSTLYIYSDGCRTDATQKDIEKIGEVRTLIRRLNWKGDVVIRESNYNKGLQTSITEGITEVIETHGKVIVMEDDILCGRHFLTYCNAALDRYENDEQVMHVNGYMFPHRQKSSDFFFSHYAMVWGWATWKRAWNRFSADAPLHLQRMKDRGTENEFDLYGAAGTLDMLKRQADGRLHTWDVLWYASIFNAKALCLTPGRSLTRNIGLDGSGAHFTSRLSRKQSRNIDWKPLVDTFPDVPHRIAENELPVIEAIRNWNRPRFRERVAGKLSLLWKEMFSSTKKSN